MRKNSKESKRNNSRKEYGLKMNLGEQIKDKFKKLSVLFKKNKKDFDINNISYSENNNDYYENFLQNLQDDEKKINKKRKSKIKKGKNEKSNISNNIKFKTLLRQSIMKSKETKDIIPVYEKGKENFKMHSILVNKHSSSKINPSNDYYASLFHSRFNSNKSKENHNERNSYILKDINYHKSIVLGNLNVRKSINQNCITPNGNFKNSYFTSINSKKSPTKFNENNISLIIKNSKSENLKKGISLKNDEKSINNSLEEESGINFKQNYNFNPQKIEVENITKKNVEENNKNNESLKEEFDKNDIKSSSESTLKIHLKKRCLFCCLPIY